ncbi:RnfABCDGE type electron transport complex subunit D [Rhizobiaceae bacterium BDR2-2]|uniref:RnfABCDGE type electron transport complex subunit D n=1 Tax=Ectorhizobium quercum TaxID=2965071 RepID=A0AAE3MZN5_9HYPH|nr:RnfABCDGE type electron transport complex subunit D [Ectorhizobium quercum]MCX8997416.1 RnfABCDGE type electron transport complex subunit D [Ectorhizobium quercum]
MSIAFLHGLHAGRLGRTALAGSVMPALLGLIAPAVAALLAGGTQFAMRLLLALVLTLAWQYVFARIRGLGPGLDGIVTATLIALLVPAEAPLWQLVLGVSFGVVIAEQVFGGRGRNFVHPAVAALAFLMFSFTDVDYRAGPDIPLATLVPALVLLLLSGQASWRLLLGAFGALALAVWAQGNDPSPILLSGAISCAILFLAADPVCSASTDAGRWAQGILTGLLIGLFSQAGSVFGAAIFAILMSSIFAPLIDYLVVAVHVKRRARRYG